MLWWIFCIVFFALLGVLLFGKWEVAVRSDEKKYIYLRLRLLSVPVFRRIFFLRLKNYIHPELFTVKKGRLVPMKQKKKRKKRGRAQIDWRALLSRLEIERLRAELTIGTGDAAQTALAAGILENAAGTALRLLLGSREGAQVRVLPNFEKEAFFMKADCIIKFRLADIILILIKKRGLKHAPNRKHLADDHV